MRIDYSIVFVSDMKRSIGFYRDVVGLPLKFESPEWTEFATEGATLALHKANAPSAEETADQRSAAGRCRTGFSVPDIDDFHRRMLENGVVCVEEPRESFGAKLAQYLDPDGMAFGISEQRSGGWNG